MNGSNGMNGSMSTNGATAKGDAMGTAPAATPKFTDSPEQAAVIKPPHTRTWSWWRAPAPAKPTP